jgi:hypothetical protein
VLHLLASVTILIVPISLSWQATICVVDVAVTAAVA